MVGPPKVPGEDEREPEREMLDIIMEGVKYKDEEMKDEVTREQTTEGKISEEIEEVNVLFGGIPMDEDGMSVMDLRPEFAMYDTIKKDLIEEEIEVALAKIRWSRMRDGDPSEVNEDDRNSEEFSKEALELEDAESRQVFDKAQNAVRMQRRKCTDMKNNRRTVLPKA